MTGVLLTPWKFSIDTANKMMVWKSVSPKIVHMANLLWGITCFKFVGVELDVTCCHLWTRPVGQFVLLIKSERAVCHTLRNIFSTCRTGGNRPCWGVKTNIGNPFFFASCSMGVGIFTKPFSPCSCGHFSTFMYS